MWPASRRKPCYRASVLSLYQCLTPYNTELVVHLFKDNSVFHRKEGKILTRKEALIDTFTNALLFLAFSTCNYISPTRAIVLKKKKKDRSHTSCVASLKMDGALKRKAKAWWQPAHLILFPLVLTERSSLDLDLGFWHFPPGDLKPTETSNSFNWISSPVCT